MSKSDVTSNPKGGFSYDLCRRNAMLSEKGLEPPPFRKTGTTIVGLVFQDGVILGADTRATEGPIVCDKNCEKIHYMAPEIYCCGAGIAADTEAVTGIYVALYKGSISATLILGGVDVTGPHLHTIDPHGAMNTLPFDAKGSGSLAAISVFETKYKEGLTRDEGVKMVSEAICSGIFNDLGSGSNVDICVITKGHTEYLRNHLMPNPPPTFVSEKKEHKFSEKFEVLSTKVTPLKEKAEIIEEGNSMEE
ncbi:hypothetical protein CsatA_017764 [Cannabis sativa]